MTRADRVIAFIERYCRVPEGTLVGQPMRLAEFQKRFIRDVYDNPAGTSRALLTMARKNGKTALIAALLITHLCGPEAKQNSQIVSGAMSRDQAALVFKLASKMIQLHPGLRSACRMVPSTKVLYGVARNVEYRALSAEASTAHGLSPALAILDEVGQIRGPTNDFVEAITTSQGAHEHPLLIAISTSAPSDADMLSVWVDDARRGNDARAVVHEYRADDNCDLMDREQWRKANPGLGIFRSEADLEDQLRRAMRLPALEASARNLLLNQRIALESLWLAPAVWKSCAAEPDISVFREYPVAMGLDLSSRTDLTAAVLAARDGGGVVHLLPFVFTPTVGLEDRARRDRAPYGQWVQGGQMVATPGTNIDYPWVARWLRHTLDDLGVEPASVEFDRWRMDVFKAACVDAGFATGAQWNPVGQGYKDMSPRIECFEGLLLAGRLRHGSHPLMNLAAASAVATLDPAGNRKLDKAKATMRIDPLVAAVMAAFPVSEGAPAPVDVTSWVA